MTKKSLRHDGLELRYQRLFETAKDGILLLDFPDGRVQDANPFITNLIGYTKAELLGKKLWELGLIADKEKAISAHQSILDSGYVRYEDIDLVTKDGRSIAVEFICNSYGVNSETVIQCNIRDISDRKKAEQALSLSHAEMINHFHAMIDSTSNLIESRDPYTAGHQKRVADLSVEIAKLLGMSDFEIEGIFLAAKIHDIGKINIPVEILTKPTSLNTLEVAMLRNHPQTGFDILKPLTLPWPISKIILQHHERLDGSGYPNALKGEEICMEAKVIAVADVVEAMTSHRPYRSAIGIDKALQEIESQSGILYESKVVASCLKLFRGLGYKFPIVNSRM